MNAESESNNQDSPAIEYEVVLDYETKMIHLRVIDETDGNDVVELMDPDKFWKMLEAEWRDGPV